MVDLMTGVNITSFAQKFVHFHIYPYIVNKHQNTMCIVFLIYRGHYKYMDTLYIQIKRYK